MSSDESTTPGPVESHVFKVNGVQIVSDRQTLTAGTILLLALEHHAIAGKPSEYLLKGEKRTYGPDQLVDLAEDNVFIAIPNKPTPVAGFFVPASKCQQRQGDSDYGR